MRAFRRAILVVTTACLPRLVAAQSLWVTPVTGKADFDLEWTRPSFDDISGLSAFRGIWVTSARARVGDRGALIVAVPRLVGSDAGTFGNPYFGAQLYRPDGSAAFTFGLRVPTISTAPTLERAVAFRGDFDRYEEAVADYLTVAADGQFRAWHDSAGADVTVRGGLSLFHPTDPTFGAKDEYYFNYGIRFGHRWTRLEVGADVTGRYYMSANGGTVTDRNLAQGSVTLGWHARVVPRVGLRLPITENLKGFYKSVVTVGVSVPVE